MSKLTDKVTELAEPIAAKNNVLLWDVELLKEGGETYLRVSIDSENGISLDDCERVSRELEPLIDALDPIEESYIFEVSSAGAERQLKRARDYELCMNRLVNVKLYRAIDGSKTFIGTLTGYSDSGEVTIVSKEESRTFAKGDIARVRLEMEW